ncbi:hypothetical protein GCM10009579_66120 [Streptomyces javensis]|uniref:Uncharacterized protein n=1 Tax=Streptomyces javensis TaxID=114698 RepID=A0ABN1X8B6_9ACTN
MRPESLLIRRLHDAISSASNGGSVRMWFAIWQPTIIREYTSRTNATYAQPDQVRTYLMSANPQLIRPRGRESWSTRSGGLGADVSGTVVRRRCP